MTRLTFPPDFLWGVATSAYQIEGAAREDGRGESVWDRFSHTPGKIRDGATGDVSADHYHRYAQDVALMRELGVTAYRFSISWSRVLPEGVGAVNQRGLDFYRRLVDELAAQGIQPLATLFHWDLPQALQDRGGWENRDTAYAFADYARVMAEALSDRVRDWQTLNEPKTVVSQGYLDGTHAPGFADPARAYCALHHLLLGHGLAAQVLRAARPQARVSLALNLSPVYADDDRPETLATATYHDGLENRLYLEPIFRGKYPEDIVAAIGANWPDSHAIRDWDLATIAAPLDFLSVNYYNPFVVAGRSYISKYPTTAAYWEQVYPPGLYETLMRVCRDYADIPMRVTENGAPYEDILTPDGQVHDPERIKYVADHLAQAHRAIQDGAQLQAYYLWSLLDNFEWGEGLAQRWGIVYVDFATQQRILKDSARWYSEVIRQHGVEVGE